MAPEGTKIRRAVPAGVCLVNQRQGAAHSAALAGSLHGRVKTLASITTRRRGHADKNTHSCTHRPALLSGEYKASRFVYCYRSCSAASAFGRWRAVYPNKPDICKGLEHLFLAIILRKYAILFLVSCKAREYRHQACRSGYLANATERTCRAPLARPDAWRKHATAHVCGVLLSEIERTGCMSTDGSTLTTRKLPSTLIGSYLSWYIACFHTGNS